MKRLLLFAHRWIGLTAAAFLIVIGLSGAAVVFENDIDRVLNPRLSYVTPSGAAAPVETLAASAASARPGDDIVGVRLPERPEISTEFLTSGGLSVHVDQFSRRVLGVRDREKSFARFLHVLHTELMTGAFGQKLVDWMDALFFVLAVSGLILWWPRKIASLRRGASWRRTNFDLHNAVGIYASIVFLVIGGSGILIGFENTLDPFIKRLNSWNPEPPPLESTPVAGARRISLDAALDRARATLPGAFASNINVPAPDAGVYRIVMKFPEDRTPAGRSRVYVDQFSGKVLFVESTRNAPFGTRVLNTKRSAHTGDLLGRPTQILYCLGALALVVQVVSGVLIWLK